MGNNKGLISSFILALSAVAIVVGAGLASWYVKQDEQKSVGSGGVQQAGGITSLNALTDSIQTITNDTNVTVTSSGSDHALGWSGTLAQSRGGLGANVSGLTGFLHTAAGTLTASSSPVFGSFFATSSSATSTIDSNLVMAGDFFWNSVRKLLAIGGAEWDQTIAGTVYNSKINTHTEGSTVQGDVALHRHSNTATNGATFYGSRSRGTEAAESVVSSGDNILDIIGVGFDGTDYEQAARIDMEVDGAPGAGDMPGRIKFYTTPDGSATLSERMRITSAGLIGIGTTTPDAGFTVASTSAYIYEVRPTSSATMTVDFSTGNQQSSILAANSTLNLSGGKLGGAYRLILCQDGTGSRTGTWANVIWPAGTAPTLTTTANKCDVLSFLYTAATSTPVYFGVSSLNF